MHSRKGEHTSTREKHKGRRSTKNMNASSICLWMYRHPHTPQYLPYPPLLPTTLSGPCQFHCHCQFHRIIPDVLKWDISKPVPFHICFCKISQHRFSRLHVHWIILIQISYVSFCILCACGGPLGSNECLQATSMCFYTS